MNNETLEMYSVKIPGSRYVLILENVRAEWVMKITLDKNVEAQTTVPNMTKRALHAKLVHLIEEVKIQVSPLQIDIMHKDLTTQVGDILHESPEGATAPKAIDFTAINEKIVDILTKFNKLEEKFDALTDRVSRLERLSPT